MVNAGRFASRAAESPTNTSDSRAKPFGSCMKTTIFTCRTSKLEDRRSTLCAIMRIDFLERARAALPEQQVQGLEHERMDLRALDIGDVAQLVVDRRYDEHRELARPLLEGAARLRRGLEVDDVRAGRGRRLDDRAQAVLKLL